MARCSRLLVLSCLAAGFFLQSFCAVLLTPPQRCAVRPLGWQWSTMELPSTLPFDNCGQACFAYADACDWLQTSPSSCLCLMDRNSTQTGTSPNKGSFRPSSASLGQAAENAQATMTISSRQLGLDRSIVYGSYRPAVGVALTTESSAPASSSPLLPPIFPPCLRSDEIDAFRASRPADKMTLLVGFSDSCPFSCSLASHLAVIKSLYPSIDIVWAQVNGLYWSSQLEIQDLPSIMLLRGSSVVARYRGDKTYAAILGRLEDNLQFRRSSNVTLSPFGSCPALNASSPLPLVVSHVDLPDCVVQDTTEALTRAVDEALLLGSGVLAAELMAWLQRLPIYVELAAEGASLSEYSRFDHEFPGLKQPTPMHFGWLFCAEAVMVAVVILAVQHFARS